jgi:Fe-S-cluster containining protein
MPTFLECQRCAACCRWPGWVRVSAEEIARIAAFLGLGEREFIARHTRLRPDRQGLALLEKPDGECEFLDGRACRIQPVKPQQCRDFPNVWNFPGFERFCRAVPRAVSAAEWRRLVRAATGRDLQAPGGPAGSV